MVYETKKDYVENEMVRPFQEALASKDEEEIKQVVYFIIWKYVEETNWHKAWSNTFNKKADFMKVIKDFEELNGKDFEAFEDLLGIKD